MDIAGAAEARVGRYFGLPQAPCLVITPVGNASFSITRLRKPLREADTLTVDLPAQAAYFLMLYLRDVHHCDVGKDGGHAAVRCYEKGSICLVDLTEGASICLHSDLDSLAFHMPRSLFDEVVEASAETKFNGLRCQRGAIDPVMGNLGAALLPLLEASDGEPPRALQPMVMAICAHLLHCYGDVPLRCYIGPAGALSVWQERAAKAFMSENFGRDIRVAEIAAAAGLSSGHFSQGFKTATGLTPHQWLIRLRVARAMHMLADRSASLADIAGRCGFTDQSHFTTVFARAVGATPAVWRARSLQ